MPHLAATHWAGTYSLLVEPADIHKIRVVFRSYRNTGFGLLNGQDKLDNALSMIGGKDAHLDHC
jgi:hypothetical protein